MATIGFIGLGNMGGPMAKNLIKKNYPVVGYDLAPANLQSLKDAGGKSATSIAALAKQCDIIITMLPAGEHVQKVCEGQEGIFENAKVGTLLIDSSSIDVATSRTLAKKAKTYHLSMIDAPVSGGMKGAEAGTLTFMVGGEKQDFERAKPLLACMGKNIFHAGPQGNGQAAKICNNMLLGISMIGTCEAFNLAQNLGLDPQIFFNIANVSSGQCWSLTNYCPAPGPVPTSPANHDYQPGFAAAMMLKDLKLSQIAARQTHTHTPLGTLATTLYEHFNQAGFAQKDFSAMIEFFRDIK